MTKKGHLGLLWTWQVFQAFHHGLGAMLHAFEGEGAA